MVTSLSLSFLFQEMRGLVLVTPMVHAVNLIFHSSVKKDRRDRRKDTAEGHGQREIKDRKAAITHRGA